MSSPEMNNGEPPRPPSAPPPPTPDRPAYEQPDNERPASATPTEQQLERELPGGRDGHDPYAALRYRAIACTPGRSRCRGAAGRRRSAGGGGGNTTKRPT